MPRLVQCPCAPGNNAEIGDSEALEGLAIVDAIGVGRREVDCFQLESSVGARVRLVCLTLGYVF